MSLTPYDWNQSIQTRTEYIEERLRDGSPVVGLSIPDGVLLVTVHRAQRKIYEIYDRLVLGGIGNQSDIETMRNTGIDFAHQEGFQRSPDDVTAYRLVVSVLSPALKRAFADPFTAPFVFRGLFAEVAERQEQDQFYALGFDGEFRVEHRFSVVAGSFEAENRMIDLLHGSIEGLTDRAAALRLGLEAWATGRLHARRAGVSIGTRDDDEEADRDTRTVQDVLREEIAEGTVEVGLLERKTPRESKFRLLRAEELQPIIAAYR
jgi:proteasome alpha subunit